MTDVDSLINSDGDPFSSIQIEQARESLGALDDAARKAFRTKNSQEIVAHTSKRLLIVSGPGTGKSFLFRDRIKYWLPLFPDHLVYVSSFVRKLVIDLEKEIETDAEISRDDVKRITVSTLHRLARSILETNHGSPSVRFAPHIQVLIWPWTKAVWRDVVDFHSELDSSNFEWDEFEDQVQTENLDPSPAWVALHATYTDLCRFYNCTSFADMITLAAEAVEAKPSLVSQLLWIIDEYQDFNKSEDRLIRAVTSSAEAVLIAGDDDQALYEQLKSSSPAIIIGYYSGSDFANAMLPFCNRCGFHICLAAAEFIGKHREATSVEKVYLPLEVTPNAAKVKVVATYTPSTAVSYIADFLEKHKDDLETHIERMKAGETSDPFLLILSPDKKVAFFKTRKADESLHELVSRFTTISLGRSTDYKKVIAYCAAGLDSSNNLAYRIILSYEQISENAIHELLNQALEEDRTLSSVIGESFPAIFQKIENVRDLVISIKFTSDEKVSSLDSLIGISDQPGLSTELDDHPITIFDDLIETGAEEAIETAGELAPVELMTIVKSKGLSAKHVIVLGCDDVNMQRLSPLAFYVALTRARESLHLITSLQARGHRPAQFVLDLPEDNCEYLTYKATGADILDSRARFESQIADWDSAITRNRKRK
ncbi:MAG: UvrD-helicase domain-containing protein [Acidimicrobiales bacterium]